MWIISTHRHNSHSLLCAAGFAGLSRPHSSFFSTPKQTVGIGNPEFRESLSSIFPFTCIHLH